MFFACSILECGLFHETLETEVGNQEMQASVIIVTAISHADKVQVSNCYKKVFCFGAFNLIHHNIKWPSILDQIMDYWADSQNAQILQGHMYIFLTWTELSTY